MPQRIDISEDTHIHTEGALMSTNLRMRYQHPPVVEVVCGVLFSTVRPLRGAHVGQFWDKVRSEFPRIEEAAPLSPLVEGGDAPRLDVSFSVIPPLRRTWLFDEPGRHLIQIQEDRFLFNWKKASDEDEYPQYEHVIDRFNKYLTMFLDFLREADLGEVSYHQFEMTYVNHIGLVNEAGLQVRETNLLVDHIHAPSAGRFLPEPVSVHWTSTYPLPNNGGRLYCIAQSATSATGARIIRLDLAARGIPLDPSEAERQGWFDQAHVWITRGFADVTAEEIQQKVWGRIS
jgi:uncharacterized protein (TIGR04255 family)